MNTNFIIACLWILDGKFAAEINAERIGEKSANRSQNFIEKFCPDCIRPDETDVKASIAASEQSPKVSEFKNRTIIVVVKPDVPPFVERRTDNPGGFFGELFDSLIKSTNLTFKYVWLPRDDDIPKFIEGEGQRLAFDLRAVSKDFGPRSTNLLMTRRNVWVVARGTDLEENNILFRPLLSNILLQSALLTICIAVATYLSRDFDRTRMISRLFGMFFGIGVGWLPKKWCLRFLIISWCLGSYFFVQIYSSTLMSALTTSNNALTIRNLSDLANSGIRMFCSGKLKEFYCDSGEEFATKICENCLLMNVDNNWEGELESISKNKSWKSYAFKSDLMIFGTSLNREPFVPIPGSSDSWPSAVYISRNINLKYLKNIKNYFSKLFEAGFLKYWAYRYVPKKINNYAIEYKPLNISDIKGAFIILSVGWACSFVVFIIELLVKRFHTN